MDTNKQIEEMAQAILEVGDNYDTCLEEDCETIAVLIYDKGYRKASDVIKAFSEELIERFNDLEYNANTPRKTVKVDELRAQIDWILHEVTINTIKEFTEKYVEAMK
jgi:endonuclease III